jgi:hypothetical protein
LDRVTQYEAASGLVTTHDELTSRPFADHVAHGIMALTEEQMNVPAAFLRHFMTLILFVMSCSSNVALTDGMYISNIR